jgi:hypothetical protein
MTKRERNMLVVLGVIAVAALAFFVIGSLGGGEETDTSAPTSPAFSPPPGITTGATPGTGVGEPTEEPPRAVTFFGGRDPFVPLIVEGPPPGESPEPGTSPAPGTSPSPGGSPAPVPEPTGVGPAVTGRPVVLVDVIDETTVQVEVEGEPMTVTEGQRFARSYEFVSVEANCARFLYGDESFRLCEGPAPK